MNRKKGIIIGTTGIIIVALALIGFTYGFYLSLISGNESSKKVKVTAGKSKLEYVELSTEVDTIIGPGYTNTKYFAVKNVGDISASYYLYLVDVENTFNRKNDIVYTIYRKAYDYSEENIEPEEFDINGTYDFSSWENVTNSHCKTVSEFTDYGDCQYPSEKSQLSTQKQTIMEKDDYYVYAFVVTYINQPEIDQIADEESVFSGVVKVYADETGTDVSPFMPGTLADAIYMNALNETNGTIYSPTPKTVPGKDVSLENERTLSVTEDNYGPSYYYRGNVEDNYVEFNNMCWRIVRIEGDGSIKITLAKQDLCSTITENDTATAVIGTGDYGYINYSYINGTYIGDYENSENRTSSMKYKFDIFLNGGSFESLDLETYEDTTITYSAWSQSNLDKLKNEEICIGNTTNKYDFFTYDLLTDEQANIKTVFKYASNLRLERDKTPSLLCGSQDDKTTSSKIYPLTADEIAFAGGNTDYVLTSNYLKDNTETIECWWTLSISLFEDIMSGAVPYCSYSGQLYAADFAVNTSMFSLRPAVSLIPGTTFVKGGEGTKTNPYVVE